MSNKKYIIWDQWESIKKEYDSFEDAKLEKERILQSHYEWFQNQALIALKIEWDGESESTVPLNQTTGDFITPLEVIHSYDGDGFALNSEGNYIMDGTPALTSTGEIVLTKY